ncbi:MAG: Redox-active disulfide protein 2 [Candidatus Magasanikbacteria bacterium GW2011_GWE2_42_7]|uniref:Redox-active disulfide protein 2 n=1 Tax=Candidatus Magasanikbacteria bacterium GW2011_GWE2_42_7 TaxID=1619052 RepID=A0A0G1BDP0_9BACT|nr:MAG: Redox-active disulfide protein 2 [Candidatus Magasanikbacteria bacterium GW2011_GWE2_42_7]
MATNTLNIKILGTGCQNCITLEHNARQAVTELGLDATVDKITDIETIMGYGVMSTPALVVNEEVQSAGRVSPAHHLGMPADVHMRVNVWIFFIHFPPSPHGSWRMSFVSPIPHLQEVYIFLCTTHSKYFF